MKTRIDDMKNRTDEMKDRIDKLQKELESQDTKVISKGNIMNTTTHVHPTYDEILKRVTDQTILITIFCVMVIVFASQYLISAYYRRWRVNKPSPIVRFNNS